MLVEVSPAFADRYPGARIGALVMGGVPNCRAHAGLQQRKSALERDLRRRYAGQARADLLATPVLAAYHAYYRQFDKTYHVLLQLESVTRKGKSLPTVNAAVEAMFMAELDDLLLTAGHDLGEVRGPVRAGVATGDEEYAKINGQRQRLAAGDMMMSDAEGVISCVLYGPDQRTRITLESTDLLFTAYAPAGVDPARVRSHLENIRDNVRVFAPDATTQLLTVLDGHRGD